MAISAMHSSFPAEFLVRQEPRHAGLARSKARSVALACLLVAFAGHAAPAIADPPTDGLVAYWSFDNPEDLGHDDSGNGHDGTIYGASPCPGACNGGLYFDGVDDYVDFGALNETAYSFCAWVTPDQTVTPETPGMTVAQFSFDDPYMHMLMLGSCTGAWDDETITLAYNCPPDPRTAVRDLDVTSTAWHLLCLIWNSTEYRYDIYYDADPQTVHFYNQHVALLPTSVQLVVATMRAFLMMCASTIVV